MLRTGARRKPVIALTAIGREIKRRGVAAAGQPGPAKAGPFRSREMVKADPWADLPPIRSELSWF